MNLTEQYLHVIRLAKKSLASVKEVNIEMLTPKKAWDVVNTASQARDLAIARSHELGADLIESQLDELDVTAYAELTKLQRTLEQVAYDLQATALMLSFDLRACR